MISGPSPTLLTAERKPSTYAAPRGPVTRHDQVRRRLLVEVGQQRTWLAWLEEHVRDEPEDDGGEERGKQADEHAAERKPATEGPRGRAEPCARGYGHESEPCRASPSSTTTRPGPRPSTARPSSRRSRDELACRRRDVLPHQHARRWPRPRRVELTERGRAHAVRAPTRTSSSSAAATRRCAGTSSAEVARSIRARATCSAPATTACCSSRRSSRRAASRAATSTARATRPGGGDRVRARRDVRLRELEPRRLRAEKTGERRAQRRRRERAATPRGATGGWIVVNAESYDDLEAVVAGVRESGGASSTAPGRRSCARWRGWSARPPLTDGARAATATAWWSSARTSG